MLSAVDQQLGADSLRDLAKACRQLLQAGDNRHVPLLLLALGCESFAQKWDGDPVDAAKTEGAGSRLAEAARLALKRNSPAADETLATVLFDLLSSDISPN